MRRADYAIACCFEKDLCVQSGKASAAFLLPVPAEYSDYLACPVRAHRTPFSKLEESLFLPPETAKVLDDIRVLTLLITDTSSQSDNKAFREKAQLTASSIYKRLREVTIAGPDEHAEDNSDDDRVQQIIHQTAIIYTQAIIKLQPMSCIKSSYKTEKTLDRNIKAVYPIRWKKMPGIYLWIMLVAAAQTTSDTIGDDVDDSEDDDRRKWLRRRLGAAAQAVGQEEFGLSIAYLRAFWLVQRWIDRERRERDEEMAEAASQHAHHHPTPTPSLEET